ncbi:hypothetical protein [Niveispirillum sp. KHB5.9]|uniref:hypothetical protein n=1 Tax=Niveispirillum sp. KHB5.9 TaxID=3400269 RepID=UPI003A8C52ED
MTQSPPKKDERKDRLAQALRDNLRRRKDQDRARDAQEAMEKALGIDPTGATTEGQVPDTTA